MRLPREFNVGDVLSLGFIVWGRNFATFIGMSALVHVPLILFFVWIRTSFEPALIGAESDEAVTDFFWLIIKFTFASAVIHLLLNGILLAATVFGAVKVLRGDRISISGCLGAAFSRIVPVLAATLIITVCTIIGAAALIVPGICIAVVWWVAIPALMTEDVGIVAALNRSATLVKGYGWHVLGLAVIMFMINFGVGKLATAVARFIPSERDTVAGVGDLIGTVIGSSMSAVMVGVAYLVLRVTKEGFETKDLESVFE